MEKESTGNRIEAKAIMDGKVLRQSTRTLWWVVEINPKTGVAKSLLALVDSNMSVPLSLYLSRPNSLLRW